MIDDDKFTDFEINDYITRIIKNKNLNKTNILYITP